MEEKSPTSDSALSSAVDRVARWRELFENIPGELAFLDLDGTILYCSWAAEDTSVEQVVGTNVFDHLSEEYRAQARALVERAIATGESAVTEVPSKRPDGSFRWWSCRIGRLTDRGQPVGVLVLFSDATDRRLMEDALRESEARYRSIFESSPELIVILNLEGTVLDVNHQTSDWLGYRRAELLGVHFRDVPFCSPATKKRIGEIFVQRIGGATIEPYEVEFLCRDGEVRTGRVHGTLLHDARGNPDRVMLIISDITDQRRAERALAEAKQAAENANRAKSRFLADVSHEIRTPMTAILGYAEMLCSSPLPPVEQAAHLKTIHRNAEALLKLVGDLLDLSTIEAQKVLIEKSPCSPIRLVDEVVSLLRVRAVDRNLTLHVEHRGPLPQTIVTDPGRVRQILVNLIGNAIKFTEQGGVRVRLSLDRSDATEPRVQVDVIDTGAGIAPEELDGLFERFRRSGATGVGTRGGSGLGLIISKRLAELLGGDITVESALGRGSTFTLRIAPGPLDESTLLEPADIEESRPSADCAGDDAWRAPLLAGRVLLAEDAPDIRRLIGLALIQNGLSVAFAEDGLAAFDAARRSHDNGNPYDLILMDMQMPKSDGCEATRRLRQAGWKGPIVALTAHAMAADRRRCLEAGCDDYLSKPLDLAHLTATVGRYIRAKDLPDPDAAPAPRQSPLLSNLAAHPTIGPILPEFVSSLRIRVARMQDAFERGDIKQLEKLAHQLKGSAGLHGFAPIAGAADTVCRRSREEPDSQGLAGDVARLIELCRRARS